MSLAAKHGPPTSVLSPLNWRYSPVSHQPADEGRLWTQRRRCASQGFARISIPAKIDQEIPNGVWIAPEHPESNQQERKTDAAQPAKESHASPQYIKLTIP